MSSIDALTLSKLENNKWRIENEQNGQKNPIV